MRFSERPVFFRPVSPAIRRVAERPKLSLPVPSDYTTPALIRTFRELVKSVPEQELIDETQRKQEISAVYFLRSLERFRNILGR